jgi:hypothetical protein
MLLFRNEPIIFLAESESIFSYIDIIFMLVAIQIFKHVEYRESI